MESFQGDGIIAHLTNVRECKKCKTIKHINQFNRYKTRHQSWCKDCQYEYKKEWFKRHPGVERERSQKWAAKHPRVYWVKATFNNHQRRGYLMMFSREDLVNMARNTDECNICGQKLNWLKEGKNGKKVFNSPSLDRINNDKVLTIHNIQIVCDRCNTSKQSRTMKEFIRYCSFIAKKYKHGEI